MGTVKSIFRVKGSIGEAMFLKTKDGYAIREKSSVSADKIAKDPAFQRTRENMAEFGRACTASKVLRQSLRSLLQTTKDRRVSNRLTTAMMKVIKADSTNLRGERTVTDGEVTLLQHFECNSNASLRSILGVQFTTAIDRTTGIMQVQVPALVPIDAISTPAGCTHYKIVAGVAAVDFSTGNFDFDSRESATLPWIATTAATLTLSPTIAAASTHPIFLVVGIQFFQELKGTYYALKDGSFNALSIVNVNAG